MTVWQQGDSLGLIPSWPSPTVIVSDGPYGVGGFDGDLHRAAGLAGWYLPHVRAWSSYSIPSTTLWFWNTEEGWAAVHPILLENGWEFRGLVIWNKGKAHLAGNVNTSTIRRVPPVTEVVGHYVRRAVFRIQGKEVEAQQWLRGEWKRARLTLKQADQACQVKNAASRKYLTSDHLWYFPPAAAFDRLANYANSHGDPAGRPYFAPDGIFPVSGAEWERLRAKFSLEFGITNVWDHPPLKPPERILEGRRALHPNQKPIALVERLIRMTSEPGDVVWDPFGGLATITLAAARLKRHAYGAEINEPMYQHAKERLLKEGVL